jgi:anti-sigma regulatory factor (Ser/Thr protein kinase)
MFLFPQAKYLLRILFLFQFVLSGILLYGFELPRSVQWPNGYNGAQILQLELDSQSNIWVLTDKGLLVMDGYNMLPVTLKDNPILGCEKSFPNKIKVVHDKLYLFYDLCGLAVLKWPFLRQELVFDKEVVDVLGMGDGSILVLFASGKLNKYAEDNVTEMRKFGALTKAEMVLLEDNKVLLAVENQAIHRLLIGFKGLDNVFPLLSAKRYLGIRYGVDQSELVFENERCIVDGLFTLRHTEQSNKQLLYWSNAPVFGVELLQYNQGELQLIIEGETFFLPVSGTVSQVQFLHKNLFYVACDKELLVFEQHTKVSTVYSDDHLFDQGFQRARRKIVVLDSQKLLMLGYPKLVKATLGNNGEITRLQLQQTNKGTSLSGELYSIYNAVVVGKKLYCVAEGKGLMHIDLDLFQVHKYNNTHLDSKGFYYAIAVIDSQTLLIGANQSVVSYHIKTNQSKSLKLKGLGVYDNIYDILPLANGEVLLATSHGLYLYDHTLRNLLWSYRDHKGDLDNLFRAVVEQKTSEFHYIWAATQNKVVVFDRHTKEVVKVLDKNSLYINFRPATFVVDTNQNMWISSFQGILGVNPITWQTIWLKNNIDLANQEFNYQSGTLLPNGKLLFGGLTTYETIDPSLLFEPRSSPDIFLTAYVNEDETGTQVQVVNMLRAPKNLFVKLPNHKLTLYFSDMQHQASFPYTFKYKIGKGPWVFASNTSSLVFSNLPYGKHKVEIHFLDALNQEIAQKYKFYLHIQEKFYKTTYFLIMMYVGIALLLVVVYLVLSNSINVKRRTLILVFLDLKNELSSYIEEAKQLSDKALKDKECNVQPDLLPSVATDILEAQTFLNLYIESLTQESVSLEQLKADLLEFLTKQFQESSISFSLVFEIENNQPLDSNLVKDIKLTVYEICNNALKHSVAAEIHIQLIFSKDAIIISAYDNGSLSNVNGIYNKGNGVSNMQKRAQRNKGFALFAINDKLGHGLKVIVKFKKR